ncbi:MAG TPA: hemerythrin domain-containing protein [Burkholderiales bacterium]|jgi:hemerythrin-like domain-containing protein
MHTVGSRRRTFLYTASALAMALAAGGLRAEEKEAGEKDVEAAEDLMREHGVLRRILLAYSAAAGRLRAESADGVPPKALADAAALFRTFGEQYHERALEEKHVFPVVQRLKGAAARYPAILKTQHDRGRAITDYITSATKGLRIAAADRDPLAKALDALVLMYQHHTAIEDTVVFPAWKNALADSEYKELSDQFEELEQKMFGRDGFEDAVNRVAAIESSLGLSDLASFTAPPPPAASSKR